MPDKDLANDVYTRCQTSGHGDNTACRFNSCHQPITAASTALA